MDIGSIFLILALFILVIIFISRPLLERKAIHLSSATKELSSLMAERDQLVTAIQDLDEDYHLGKIPVDTYPTQRQDLLQKGADILRQIDTYQPAPANLPPQARMTASLSSPQILADDSAAQVTKNGGAVPPVPDDELEQRIAARRRVISEKASGFCPRCGRPVHASDRFCPKCGTTLV